MAILIILSSVLCLAAIAVPQRNLASWLKSRFAPRHKESQAASMLTAPVITRDDGWTLIRCDDEEAFKAWLGRDEEGLPYRPGEEPSLGSHLLVELFGCDSRPLELESSVRDAMLSAAVESEATIVENSFHEFQPYGVSGAVIIQESHYTIHTWPEHGYAAVDLFYCGGTVKVHRAIEVLQSAFRPTRIKFLVVRRGVQSEVNR